MGNNKENWAGKYAAQLGMQTGAGLIGSIGNGLFGMMFGRQLAEENDRRQLEMSKELGQMQLGWDKELTDYQRQMQMQMWNDTNYGAQKAHMKAAGLNPGLMYGMSGGGSATVGAGAAHSSGAGSNAPKGGGEILSVMDIAQRNAQLNLINAQTEQVKAETEKTKGVDTDNVKADTQNKIAQEVVNRYLGKEGEAQFNIKDPLRDVEAKTYQDELEARQGVAGTIYELWLEGKLHEKSVTEVEQLLLSNAKTREEIKQITKQMDLLEENIKSARIGNIISDLEMRLQKETGIDKTSPAFMKVLGRLFVEFFSKKNQ